jgi:hypothetical protein
MTVRQDISGTVNNDLGFVVSLTYNFAPISLATYTPTVIVKPSQASPDSAGAVYNLGAGLTVLSSPAGRVQLQIPRAACTTPGTQWYRIDVTNGVGLWTAVCGSFTLMAA